MWARDTRYRFEYVHNIDDTPFVHKAKMVDRAEGQDFCISDGLW